MELNLSRVDYLHMGSSFPNCIKILPTFSDDRAQHKVLINTYVVGIFYRRTEAKNCSSFHFDFALVEFLF
jgi:hypothetical protein